MLKIYNEKAETQLFTDASKHGFGGILTQRCAEDDQFHPVYYMSEKTTREEERCESYLLEALAVVKAIKKFIWLAKNLHWSPIVMLSRRRWQKKMLMQKWLDG